MRKDFIAFFMFSVLISQTNTNPTLIKPKNIYIPTLTSPENFSVSEWSIIVSKATDFTIDSEPAGTEKVSETAGATFGGLVSTHIIGGSAATRYQFPWQVAVSIDNAYFCGGSLISREWVLTAAHCTDGFTLFTMTFGAQNRNINDAGREILSSKVKFVHPQYDENTVANDLGIIKLPTLINLSASIGTIRLPKTTDASKSFAGIVATVSGFGLTADGGSTSSSLQFIDVPVIPNQICLQTFGSTYIIKSTICTSGAKITGTCNGDSGGPLVYKETDGKWTQIGVVSFGSSQCVSDAPSAYARVTSFLAWISQVTNIAIDNGLNNTQVAPPSTTIPTVMKVKSVPKRDTILHFRDNITLLNTIKKLNTPKVDLTKPLGKVAQVHAGKSAGFGYNGSTVTVVRGTFPWQAAIRVINNNKKWFCDGALIRTNWVLTSATCTYEGLSFEVTLGAFQRTVNETDRVMVKTNSRYEHSSYNSRDLSSDLALLKLPISVQPSKTIGIVRLPKQSDTSKTLFETTAILSGWGYFANNYSVGSILNYVNVTVISTFNCSKFYGTNSISYIFPSNLCTTGTTLKNGLCGIDSGAPLIYKESDGNYTILGVVSFSSANCFSITDPVVFTRITSFISWISTKTDTTIRI